MAKLFYKPNLHTTYRNLAELSSLAAVSSWNCSQWTCEVRHVFSQIFSDKQSPTVLQWSCWLVIVTAAPCSRNRRGDTSRGGAAEPAWLYPWLNLFRFKFGCNAQHQNMPETASVGWVVLRMSLGVTVCLASVSGATEPLWSGGHCSTRGWAPPTLQAKVYGEWQSTGSSRCLSLLAVTA